MLEKGLEKLGFSPSEIVVYLHLLENGPSFASKLSFETRINRTNVYEALDRLCSKGVVSNISRNKVKWFQASPPGLLETLLKEKEEEFKWIKSDISSYAEQFKKRSIKDRPLEASIFLGKTGLKLLFEEMLREAKTIYFLASQHQFKTFFGTYFEQWHNRRIRLGIFQKSIFPKSFSGKLPKRKYLEYHFVDNIYTSPTATVVYGDICLFIQWADDPIAVRIKSAKIAQSHINYFNLLWRRDGK